MYKVGTYIIKNVNGVCKIEDIVCLDGANSKKKIEYYFLRPINNATAKIYLPVESAERVSRNIMSKNDALSLINSIEDIEELSIENERQRETCYKEAIKDRKPDKLVSVIKSLYFRKQKRLAQGKKNTSTDERYLKTAEEYLYTELGFVLGIDKNEVCDLICQTINNKKDEQIA